METGQTQTNGVLRGRPPAPSQADVQRAYQAQAADIRSMLSSRLA